MPSNIPTPKLTGNDFSKKLKVNLCNFEWSLLGGAEEWQTYTRLSCCAIAAYCYDSVCGAYTCFCINQNSPNYALGWEQLHHVIIR